MVQKIALEEHFLSPDFIDYWNPTAADLPAERRRQALARLTDFGEIRLATMDKAGIARAVLGRVSSWASSEGIFSVPGWTIACSSGSCPGVMAPR